MDRIAQCLLEKLCLLAPIGRYVVVSADELFENFPEGADRNENELKKSLKSLAGDGFIDLKYQDGEYFCAAPLKKFVPEPEPTEVELTEETDVETPKSDCRLLTFIASFTGGLAGGALGCAAAYFILSLV